MNITLRLEKPSEHRAVEILTREAFWGYAWTTCDEHYLVHNLRQHELFIPELDFVAEVDGELAGNIMYSKATVTDNNDVAHEVITFGPLSVLPKFRNMGVGSALVRHSTDEARRLGYRAVVIYGHPEYYPRLGFVNSKAYGITNPEGKNLDALMALPLYEGALDGITGVYRECSVFDVDADKARAYDATFPLKAPPEMRPISILLDRLDEAAREAVVFMKIENLETFRRLSAREIMLWEGMSDSAMTIINETLREYNLPEKRMF